MQNFTYHAPTRVIFGAGVANQVGEELLRWGAHRVLVLYGGGSAVKSGLIDQVSAALTAAGLTFFLEGGVQPNPILSLAQSLVDRYRDQEIDYLLAVGGGSVIDTAKAVAQGLVAPDVPVWDYYSGAAAPHAALPVGSVLTIAAAGSETSDSTVLTNEATGQKRGFLCPHSRPQFTLMDPALTLTLPPYQTACGVADIFMHTLDRYFTPVDGNQLTDELAEAILRVVAANGLKVVTTGSDLAARSEIMWCGSLSHNGLTGLGRPRDFSVHQLGHELSGRFHLTHGASLTIMWPAWARAVVSTDYARFARYGRKVWGIGLEDDEAAAMAAILATEAFFLGLGLPISFEAAPFGIQPESVIDALAHSCSFGGARTIGAFHPLDEAGMAKIYQMANH